MEADYELWQSSLPKAPYIRAKASATRTTVELKFPRNRGLVMQGTRVSCDTPLPNGQKLTPPEARPGLLHYDVKDDADGRRLILDEIGKHWYFISFGATRRVIARSSGTLKLL